MKGPILIALLLVLQSATAVAHPGAEDTLEHLTQAIQARPTDQKLYIQRGSIYSNEGRFEAALADYKKAEALGEPILVASYQGELHYRMGDFDAARKYFDTFLKHFPKHAQSLEYRARLLRDAGEHEAALADFNAYFALQKQPNPGHYISSANLLKGLEGQGIPAALEMLDQGMVRLGVIPQLQNYAIELELERKNTGNAIERLKTLEPTLGTSPDWKVSMGELLLLAGQPAQASALFDEATAQLKKLRSTVARQRVLEKLEDLKKQLSQQS